MGLLTAELAPQVDGAEDNSHATMCGHEEDP
jgi:hypothetical protein